MKLQNHLFLFFLSTLLCLASCGTGTKPVAADSLLGKDSIVTINEQIRKDPGNLNLYLERSKIFLARKDYGASMADIDRIIAIDSSKADF